MKIIALLTLLSVSATPALARFDRCLIGIWRADERDMAEVLQTVTGAEQTRWTDGAMLMQVEGEDRMDLESDGLSFAVKMPDTPEVRVSVAGGTTSTITAESGRFATDMIDTDVSAVATVMGMQVPFDNLTFLAGGATGTYLCSGDSLTFTPEGPLNSIPRYWTRQ